MTVKLNFSPTRITLFLAIIVVVLTILSFTLRTVVVLQGADSGVLHGLSNYFNLDNEGNIPTWFSSILLSFAGLTLLVAGYLTRQTNRPNWLNWVVLGLIFLGLSLDEYIGFHERAVNPLNAIIGEDVLTRTWIIPAGIFVAVLGLLYLRFFFNLSRKYQVIFAVAGICYLMGAMGIELLGGNYTESLMQQLADRTVDVSYNIPYLILANLEEFMEMSGVVILIYGVLDYCRIVTLKPVEHEEEMLLR